MSNQLPSNPNLEYDKKQARALLKAYKAGDSSAVDRVNAVHPRLENMPKRSIPPSEFKLSDAQLVIAREYGFSTWAYLKHHIETVRANLTETFAHFVNAVTHADINATRELLTATPALAKRINDPVIGFDSPAIVIAASTSRELVDVLLEFGADINVKSAWWAGAFGVLHGVDADTAHFLIERGAKLDIHAATEQNMMEKVRELLEADSTLVNSKGPDGQRPLHFAHTVEMIDYLLAQGADINARDVDHRGTPAQWMVEDRTKLCRYLISRGAEADIFMACALGDSDLVKQILENDPEAVNRRIGDEDYSLVPPAPGGNIYFYSLGENKSPYQIAKNYGYQRLYDYLLEHSSLQRRFIAACEQGDIDLAETILAQAPDIAASIPRKDQRLLADAAWENDLKAVRLMLKVGFDTWVRGSDDSTPLDRAAFHGFREVVQLLLEHNPPLTERNCYGGTPLRTAIFGSTHSWRSDGNFPATIEALIKAGSVIEPDAIPSGNDEVDSVLRRYLDNGPKQD